MATPFTINRRKFIKLGIGTGATLALGFNLTACNEQKALVTGENDAFQPNVWLRVSTDNVITVVIPEAEMGQGITTSLAMLVAEELDANWQTVHFKQASSDPKYGHQGTSGSTSIRNGWDMFRQAGAIAREMLILAAAKKWEVSPRKCVTEQGVVTNKVNGESLSYGQLTSLASKLPVPTTAHLKDPKDFTIIGHSKSLLDAPDKINGTAQFGMDINLPNMLFASITHCPVFGGTLRSFDDTNAQKIPGVVKVLQIDQSVAVVARSQWVAEKARRALKINWDNGSNEHLNSKRMEEDYTKALKDDAAEIILNSSATKDTSKIKHTIEAIYSAPLQAHATMEPMNCTAFMRQDECDLWVPTQSPTYAKSIAINHTFSGASRYINKIKNKLSEHTYDNIRVHTTFLGGGFGRRLEQDYVSEAVQISKAMKCPIKLMWSREEDMQHGFYRPATMHKLTTDVDQEGYPINWNHRIVGPTRGKSIDGAKPTPYAIPNIYLDYVEKSSPIPIGSWRSVGNSHNTFVIESFIDELAHSAQKDPLQYRLDLLKNEERYKAVLQLAAEKAGWGKPSVNGTTHGIAIRGCFGSIVAQIASVSISANGAIKVPRIVCVVDCGIAVNPNTIKAQMESGIIFGLTACLKSSITIENGRVAQNNFHDFPLLTMKEMPLIETYIINSGSAPGGIGEAGVPPIAPAVANAIFAATGKRLRSMPFPTQLLKNFS